MAVRDVVNGLMYILSTGSQWRAIPEDQPLRARRFIIISICGAGTARSITFTTRFMRPVAKPPRAGQARPAAIINSQSAKSAEKGDVRSTRRATMQARGGVARALAPTEFQLGVATKALNQTWCESTSRFSPFGYRSK